MSSFNGVQGNNQPTSSNYFFKVEDQTRRRGFLWLKKVQVKVLVLYRKDLEGTERKVDSFSKKGIRLLLNENDGRTLHEKRWFPKNTTTTLIENTDSHRVARNVNTNIIIDEKNPLQKKLKVSLQSLKGFIKKFVAWQLKESKANNSLNNKKVTVLSKEDSSVPNGVKLKNKINTELLQHEYSVRGEEVELNELINMFIQDQFNWAITESNSNPTGTISQETYQDIDEGIYNDSKFEVAHNAKKSTTSTQSIQHKEPYTKFDTNTKEEPKLSNDPGDIFMHEMEDEHGNVNKNPSNHQITKNNRKLAEHRAKQYYDEYYTK